MKISAFTFIKNGQILGYPFKESILSVLPIVDEFIVNVGKSEDDTLEFIKSIKSPKVKIIESSWNDVMSEKGYVYGQQKMISQFNCNGDWAFYIEGDEIYHEDDLKEIKSAMKDNLHDKNVEAFAFKFRHFYGNPNTYIDSPGWYRSEVRIIRNNIRSYAPDGLFWVVLDRNKIGRYPRAKLLDIHCFHYGWVRSQDQMNLKSSKVQKYWGKPPVLIDYSQMDRRILREFKESHPKVIRNWLPKGSGLFSCDPSYIPSAKQKKHFLMRKIEKLFNIDLSKRHYQLIK